MGVGEFMIGGIIALVILAMGILGFVIVVACIKDFAKTSDPLNVIIGAAGLLLVAINIATVLYVAGI